MVKNFGIWLREKRSFLGLRQKDLAALLGISPKSISHYETGNCKPPNQKEFENVIRAMVKEKEYQNTKKENNEFQLQELLLFDEESPEPTEEKEERYFTKDDVKEFHSIYSELFSFLLHGGLTKEQRKTLFVLLDKQFDLLKKYDFEG